MYMYVYMQCTCGVHATVCTLYYRKLNNFGGEKTCAGVRILGVCGLVSHFTISAILVLIVLIIIIT